MTNLYKVSMMRMGITSVSSDPGFLLKTLIETSSWIKP